MSSDQVYSNSISNSNDSDKSANFASSGSSSLYFHVGSEPAAMQLVDSLREQGIAEEHVHVISDDQNVALTKLPNSDLSTRSDLFNALKRGGLIGAILGFLIGTTLAIFPLIGFSLGVIGVAFMTIGGAVFGAWAASLIGISEPHPIVDRLAPQLAKGGFVIVAETALAEGKAESLADRIAATQSLTSENYGVYQSDITEASTWRDEPSPGTPSPSEKAGRQKASTQRSSRRPVSV